MKNHDKAYLKLTTESFNFVIAIGFLSSVLGSNAITLNLDNITHNFIIKRCLLKLKLHNPSRTYHG